MKFSKEIEDWGGAQNEQKFWNLETMNQINNTVESICYQEIQRSRRKPGVDDKVDKTLHLNISKGDRKKMTTTSKNYKIKIKRLNLITHEGEGAELRIKDTAGTHL